MRGFSLGMLMIAFAFGTAGCAMHDAAAVDNAPAPASTGSATDSSGTTTDQAGSATPAPPPIKMVAGFDDIPVPSDLTRNDKLSFIYEAPSVTMGVITYSGYDKGASVAKFFRTQMPNYGWQFLNAFSQGDRYMVAFLKADRSCIISIEEGTLSTRVTIKVGPTSAGGAGGAVNANPNPPLHYEVGH